MNSNSPKATLYTSPGYTIVNLSFEHPFIVIKLWYFRMRNWVHRKNTVATVVRPPCSTDFPIQAHFMVYQKVRQSGITRSNTSWHGSSINWGASSRWSLSLYYLMRNSGQMTIRKRHRTTNELLMNRSEPDSWTLRQCMACISFIPCIKWVPDSHISFVVKSKVWNIHVSEGRIFELDFIETVPVSSSS